MLAVDHLVTRTGLARRYPPLFYAVVALHAVLALWMLLVGWPGLPGLGRVMVALVLTMHVAQDFRLRQQWSSEDREAELDREYREARKLAEEEESRQREAAGDPPEG